MTARVFRGLTEVYGHVISVSSLPYRWPVRLVSGECIAVTVPYPNHCFPQGALLRFSGEAVWDSETLRVREMAATRVEAMPERPIGEILDDMRKAAGIENAHQALREIDE